MHKVSGPACAFIGPTRDFKGSGATLIPCAAGGVRPLSITEIAKAQGVTAPEWQQMSQTLGSEQALRRLVREPGWQVAASLLGLWQTPSGKAGNCLDPEEEEEATTCRSYNSGWKQWACFMSGTGVSPFLQGDTRLEKQADEDWLIRFVVFLHQVMGLGRTAQGIKQRLSGIQYAHIAAGYPDPLSGRVRLWAALAGMNRWGGAPVRKVPVTPRMLTWLKRYLDGSDRPLAERSALWTSICLGWFFMLRASEYLPGPS